MSYCLSVTILAKKVDSSRHEDKVSGSIATHETYPTKKALSWLLEGNHRPYVTFNHQ